MLSQSSQNHIQRLSTFQAVLNHIESSNWKSALVKGCRNYNVKAFNVEKLTPDKVRELYKRIHQRFYLCQRSKNGVWIENQLRLFIWILILASEIQNKSPEHYTDDDWKPLATIFEGKSLQTCKFQYKSITNKKVTLWNQEQEELLKKMIQQRNEINPNWNEISRDLFHISHEKYFKTSKQCRQHWNNYLNPHVLKSQWSKKQDYLLMKHVVEKGKQWSTISKLLEAKRTEHMVKNRFKSLVLTYSKEFNISKKHSESQTVLQRIFRQLKSEIQGPQQFSEETIRQIDEEKEKQISPGLNPKKSAFQLVHAPSSHESTTVGVRSPTILSPYPFTFQFPQGIFPHFIVQLPVLSLDANLFHPGFYQMINQDHQQSEK